MYDSDSRWDHEFFAYQCHNVPIKRTTLHFFQNFANRTSTINRHRGVLTVWFLVVNVHVMHGLLHKLKKIIVLPAFFFSNEFPLYVRVVVKKIFPAQI